MGKINVDWHNLHKMPKNPSREERLSWHIQHSKCCDCRKPSPKLLAEIEEFQNSKE